MGACLTVVHRSINLNAGSLVTTKLIPLFALAAEGPGLVVADSVRAAALRILSALIVVITCASIAAETSSTLTSERCSLSDFANSIRVTSVSSGQTWVLLRLPSIDVSDLAGQGEADESLSRIVSGKNVVHA